MNNHKTTAVRFVVSAVSLAIASCAPSTEQKASFSSPATQWELETLSSEQGISFRIAAFAVPPGREEQSCYFLRVPDLDGGKDLWIDRVHMAMNPGSHHMNIFRVRTEIGLRPQDGEPTKVGNYDATVLRGSDEYATHPCWDSSNWADWPLIANTQASFVDNPYTDWRLPEGVATRLTPGEMLMIQTHYVNTTTQPTPANEGSVGINLHRTKTTAPQELGTLFATQQNIRICQSNPEPVFSGTCRFPGNVTITAANGHFHSRGQTFDMFRWDGRSLNHPSEKEQFYQSESWDHPPMRTDIDMNVPRGGGIWWDCGYRWRKPAVFDCDDVNAKDSEGQGECCYTFGGNTDLGEHCNVFLYYYPKVADTDVFCN